jgi:hypothetical protein
VEPPNSNYRRICRRWGIRSSNFRNITTIRSTITTPNSKDGNGPTAAACSTTVRPTIAKLHTISANVPTRCYVSAVPADALIWESKKLQSITGRQRVSTARENGLLNSIKLTQSISGINFTLNTPYESRMEWERLEGDIKLLPGMCGTPTLQWMLLQ